tara:strand:- start:1858 stop:2382 length:525 start_codon:yes stop_codon:yes gene_type:complete
MEFGSRFVATLLALFAFGTLGTGASAQANFYERVGDWTVIGNDSFCTAPGIASPFPDGTMPPWKSISLYMADPMTLEVRYGGPIAANAPSGAQEGQLLLRSLDGKTDYFRPRIIVADEPGGSRLVTAIIEGEPLETLGQYDYFLLRAGDQMLPLALTPHRDELLDAMRRCVERL